MIHTCLICGRTKNCDPNDVEPCNLPEKINMNCHDEFGKAYHQEEYLKAIGVKK